MKKLIYLLISLHILAVSLSFSLISCKKQMNKTDVLMDSIDYKKPPQRGQKTAIFTK